MRYQTLPNDFYQKNRKKFIDKIGSNSLAIFHSNDPMPTNADGTMGFRQNNDLFYLTGIDQEETALLLDWDGNEVLFVRETNDLIRIWEGDKLTKAQASTLSGIKEIRWFKEFDAYLKLNIDKYKSVYLSQNQHTRADNPVETRNDRLNKGLKNLINSSVDILSSAPIMHLLRYFKEKEEVNQLQQACNITEKAFRRVLGFVQPNCYEFEIEAEITHEFTKNRSRGHAYQPIIASGANACILHYIDNNAVCKDGDLILMDFGAEYGNYNADLTRTIPVNGRFTGRQKEVYEAVLRVHDFAKTLLVPNNTFDVLNKEVGLYMQSELIALGLLDKYEVSKQNPEKPLFKQYYMHGTSHSLGLDVHDVDDRSLPFASGMVFTCEPGIYIPKENLGIRIENNLQITHNGNQDLMANIPIRIEEIEDLMHEARTI